MLEQLRAWWEKCRGWLWEGAGQGGSILLDGLDGREGLEHALDDERTQLLEALDGLADEHQHVGRRRLVLVAQELDQLRSATHNSNYIMYMYRRYLNVRVYMYLISIRCQSNAAALTRKYTLWLQWPSRLLNVFFVRLR